MISSSQWDVSWGRSRWAPKAMWPWRNYLSWKFHRVFSRYIERGDNVLEIGCGGSRKLPYFAKTLGANVSGFDYAQNGVNSSKEALDSVNVKGDIRLGDLFEDTIFRPSSFDVVWSAGFIEHFPDTVDVVSRIARFVKPGGLVITETPNMGSFMGKLHKVADPDLYAQHVVITPERMDLSHTKAGLVSVEPAQYFGTLALTVVGYGRRFHPSILPFFTLGLEALQLPITLPLWLCRTSFETAQLSPFVLGVYRKEN
jgi:2-polyprenyl-3-methyl-5-hydroxy-6-metoxy-1,4-benzoquinol methylase